jgi:hypothetical protein
MNHAITLSDLLLTLGVIGGIVCILFGVLSAYGNMMADTAGDEGKSGCIITLIGLAILIGSIAGIVS